MFGRLLEWWALFWPLDRGRWLRKRCPFLTAWVIEMTAEERTTAFEKMCRNRQEKLKVVEAWVCGQGRNRVSYPADEIAYDNTMRAGKSREVL